MLLKRVAAVSIFLVALTLVPEGAHLMSLANKIGMNATDYLAAQQVYRGWAFAGILILLALVANAWFVFAARRERVAFAAGFTSLICLVFSQVSFWLLTFPGNTKTSNWTMLPTHWQALRFRWELGHAIGAVLTLIALIALLIASTCITPIDRRG